MKQFLAIGLLIFGAAVASGQTNEAANANTPCALGAAQAPQVNGLKLGMTVDEVLALFPGSSEDKNIIADRARAAGKLGAGSFTIIPEKYPSQTGFAGIGHLIFRYIDGRVYNLRVGFNGPAWKSVDEFIAKFTDGKNLPGASAWEALAGMDTQMKTLKCSGLEISLFAGGEGGNLNYVELRDTESERLLKERRAKAKAQEQQDAEKKVAKP